MCATEMMDVHVDWGGGGGGMLDVRKVMDVCDGCEEGGGCV